MEPRRRDTDSDGLSPTGSATGRAIVIGPYARRHAARSVAARAEQGERAPAARLEEAVGLALAIDRVRGLGHALVDGHLVARSGSLDRRREALATPSIIGWNLRATWPQRRAGLTDLTATTAGGRQRVRVLDILEPDGIALARTAQPGLLDQFLA